MTSVIRLLVVFLVAMIVIRSLEYYFYNKLPPENSIDYEYIILEKRSDSSLN